MTGPTFSTSAHGLQTETLETLAAASRYNQWIFDAIQPWLGSHVLEVGCGIGTFTQMLLAHVEGVTALDIFPDYIETISQRVHVPPGKCLEAKALNLFSGEEPCVEALGLFNTVMMLNVLEHLPDDHQALTILKGRLTPKGNLILLVPAGRRLYSDYDKAIHHYRRYNKKSLKGALTRVGYRVKHLQYFNAVGIMGWWLQFCLLGKKSLSPTSVGLFDDMVPLLRRLESAFPPPVGLSLLAVATPTD